MLWSGFSFFFFSLWLLWVCKECYAKQNMIEMKLLLLLGRRAMLFIGPSEELAFLDPTRQIRSWPNYSFWISLSCRIEITQVFITSTAFSFGMFSVLRRGEKDCGQIQLEMIPALTIREQPAWGCSARKDKGDRRSGRGRYWWARGTIPQYLSMVIRTGLKIAAGFSHSSSTSRHVYSDKTGPKSSQNIKKAAFTLWRSVKDQGKGSDIFCSSQATEWECTWMESPDEACYLEL